MKFVIEATGITHWLSVLISSPQSGRCCFTVCTICSFSPRRRLKCHSSFYLKNKENIFLIAYQSSLGLDKRPVLSVHFIIETTGIAEIVTIAVPPPQRCRGRPAVHTFSPLWNNNFILDNLIFNRDINHARCVQFIVNSASTTSVYTNIDIILNSAWKEDRSPPSPRKLEDMVRWIEIEKQIPVCCSGYCIAILCAIRAIKYQWAANSRC